jgi:predicted component of type VI protein secretion system
MKIQLVVLSSGKWEGKRLVLTEFPFVIGRAEDCSLRPTSPLIQPRHCALLLEDSRLLLRLFIGAGLTYVNDHPVDGCRQLASDDVLRIGPLTFRVRIDKPAAAVESMPKPAPVVHAADDDLAAAMLLGMDDTDEEVDYSGVRSDPSLDSTLDSHVDTLLPVSARSRPSPAPKTDNSQAARTLLFKYQHRLRG